MNELNRLTASEMARLVQRREVSPVELVESHLVQIDRLNPRLNAFVFVDHAGARAQAQQAEQRVLRGDSIGPLHGVPVSIKSSIDVEGFPVECGTRLRRGNVARSHAPLVERLIAAGAIVLGNTNVPELLMAWETDNLLYGRTNNPWDLTRTPGGSSGGESAAIAARCSAGGIGSDGGGSIRVPAHFTGICGLKPTPGRIPATGHFPASAGPFALLGVVGPMARTIEDLRLLFEAIAGPDDGDPSAAPVSVQRFPDLSLPAVRIGFFEEDGRIPVTDETAAAVRTAAAALTACGCEVVPFRPRNLERIRQFWWNLFGLAGGLAFAPMLAGHDDELSPTLKNFRQYVAASPPLTLDILLNSLFQRDVLRRHLLAEMDECPVFLCPVTATPAFRHGEREWTVQGKSFDYLDAVSYSQWFNLTGNPAAVVPVGQSPQGLPIGVQVVGKPFQEELVLAVAAAIERACSRKLPSLNLDSIL